MFNPTHLVLKDSSFLIRNLSNLPMRIIHEPEGFDFMVPSGEEVTIVTRACENTVQLWQSIDHEGICINLMPDGSFYTVVFNGVNVFETFL